MNKKKTALLLAVASLAGLCLFAVLFAMGVEQLHWGRIFVYFALATVCVETFYHSVRWLVREKRKKS